ncbi:MAG: hypothetical protein QOE65_132 [Solirubrobacteraceae bacterium]|jgi:hypothetical protein|nr:hypothetical protein [Solirubrobacteraceae bacterium]
MSRRITSILALVGLLALAVTGTASAANTLTVTPKRPGPGAVVKVTVKNPKVRRAFNAHGKLYAQLTPPPVVQNADGDVDGCAIHHPPQGRYLPAGRHGAKKAVFKMNPGDALAGPGRWCAGLWKVRLYAMTDQPSDTTDSGWVEITLARTTFTAHA